MNQEQRAARAWTITGRPAAQLADMTPGEIARLADLVGEDGSPGDHFTERFWCFYDDFLEARKATEETPALPPSVATTESDVIEPTTLLESEDPHVSEC